MPQAPDIDVLRRRVLGKRWLWVERPTLLHERAKGPGQCSCGCESRSGKDPDDWGAVLVETLPGPELLINTRTGARLLRSAQSELDGSLKRFDRIKRSEHVQHVYLPRRAYPKQLAAIVAKPKVKGLFGGIRGGKTGALAEEFVDEWVENGGRGVLFWWVAPVLKDTTRCVRKLIEGEAIRGGRNAERRPPLLPAALVRSWPRNLEAIKRSTPIVLVDGSVLELRYAGRDEAKDGGNLKGDPVAWIGVDEGAEIRSSAAWHELIGRTTDSGGTLTTATTPKVGSPLKHMIHDEGTDLVANDGEYLTGYVHLSMRDNPWIKPREVKRTTQTLLREPNGEQLVEQNVDGRWVVPGGKMWEHFDEDAHVIEWHRRDLVGYKLDGRELRLITEQVVSGFFDRTTAKDLTRYGGQDFNNRGHCTVILQWWCPVDLEPADHENWVLFVEDVVIKAGEPGVAAKFLRNQAGAKRYLKHDYFAGMAISCDSTGAQDRVAESATGNVHSLFTFCEEFVRAGFDMRACHRSENGKPINPEKLAQQSLLHKLMHRPDRGQLGPRYAAGEARLPPSRRLLIRKASCPELVTGLREQARTDKGFLRKRSDTRDDRISDPVDALLYGIWPVLSMPTFYSGRPTIHWE